MTGLTSVLGRYVASRDELRHEDITRAELLAGTENVEPSLAFYAVVIVLALLAPQVAAFGFLVIAVSTVLGPWRTRGPRPGR